MKALIYDGTVRLDTKHPVPERKSFEVLIRVLKAGICRTDLEIIKGYLDFKGILGHEFVGVVQEGPDSNLLGKRVVGEINISCGKCIYCLRGLRSHCRNRSALGIQNRNGVFAEYVCLPIENIHAVPDAVSDDQAIFVEPLAAALSILNQVHVRPEESVIILGDGKLGILCAQVIKMSGAQVLAVGKHLEKLAILGKRGIRTCTVDELSREKADIVVECTGAPSGFRAAFDLIHPRGTIVLKSTYAAHPKVDLSPIVINEITVVGSRCGSFPPAIRFLEQNAIDTESLISKRFPLGRGFAALRAAKESDVLKVVLDIC